MKYKNFYCIIVCAADLQNVDIECDLSSLASDSSG